MVRDTKHEITHAAPRCAGFPALVVAVFLLVPVASLFAQLEARVRDIRGTVEVQRPNGPWEPATENMVLEQGWTISTAFRAEATIAIGETMIQVRPVTRLTLAELIERDGGVSTDLYLRVGRVRADVRSSDGLAQDFQLRSPVSTASVRGTSFEYDGENLQVFEGTVVMGTPSGAARAVQAGQVSQAPAGNSGGGGAPSAPADEASGQSSVPVRNPVVPTAAPPGASGSSAGGQPAGGQGVAAAPVVIPPALDPGSPITQLPVQPTTGTVVIQVTWETEGGQTP